MSSFNDFYNIYKSTAKTTDEIILSPNKQKEALPVVYEKNQTRKAKSGLQPVKSSRLVIFLVIYREFLTPWEIRNLRNSFEILSDYDLCVMCPENMPMEWFERLFSVKPIYYRLNRIYFRSKESYSRLMERYITYRELSAWEYMLIIQPDVWLFRHTKHHIEEFIDAGHIYLGAPWTAAYTEKLGIKSPCVGNGGLSLRNVSKLTDILKTASSNERNQTLTPVEDQYISYILYKKGLTAPIGLANQFSIDNDFEIWHKELVDELPFGVHMSKPDMRSYWEPYILADAGTDSSWTQIIVSLTSFGKRLQKDCPVTLRKFIESQTVKPDKIVLTIYKDDVIFLPEELKMLEASGVLEIIIAEDNLRPHLKYFYVMEKYPDAIIITIDDDNIYYPKTIENLLTAHYKHPECVTSMRCHRITRHPDGSARLYENWMLETAGSEEPSHELFATGVGGVLYPPGVFKGALDKKRIMEFITTDDIYLKELEVDLGIMVVTAYSGSCPLLKYIGTKSAKQIRLCDQNTQGQKINDINIKKSSFYKSANKRKIMRTSGRKVVYTCISGNYDTLREPSFITPGWEYICFTDQPLTSKTWKTLPLPKEIMEDAALTQVKRQRIVKIQPWRFIGECEVCVWTDANLTICCDLDEFVSSVGDNVTLATVKHPQRKDIYEESQAIVRYKKDKMANLQPMLDIYKKAGYPKKSGLHETNVIIRRKTSDVEDVMNMWEELLRKYSHRDQMSFDYVLWKLGLKITDILPATRNKFFKMMPHQKKKN